MANEIWKYGLAAGLGAVVGAAAVVVLSRGDIDIKKTAAALLSHGLDAKDKAAAFVDTAKENIEDIAAEARHEQGKRKSGGQQA
ncbi:MAG: hypothetical protein LBN33_07505 [Desulfovibrio sp.]|jgi:hypothetical protein|nr:hypothetical protein [Desulfovibrio sp.]